MPPYLQLAATHIRLSVEEDAKKKLHNKNDSEIGIIPKLIKGHQEIDAEFGTSKSGAAIRKSMLKLAPK